MQTSTSSYIKVVLIRRHYITKSRREMRTKKKDPPPKTNFLLTRRRIGEERFCDPFLLFFFNLKFLISNHTVLACSRLTHYMMFDNNIKFGENFHGWVTSILMEVESYRQYKHRTEEGINPFSEQCICSPTCSRASIFKFQLVLYSLMCY